MDLRLQTSLFAAVVAIALATSLLLRGQKRKDHFLFAAFAMTVGLWYLTAFLFGVLGADYWARLNVAFGVLLPLTALELFRTFGGEEKQDTPIVRPAAAVIAFCLLMTAFTDYYNHVAVSGATVAFVLFTLAASLQMMRARAQRARSRFEAGRLMLLLVVGAVAAVFTILEYLPYLGLEMPPVGGLLVLIFLFMLHQSVLQLRVLDLYELAFRLAVLTVLSFLLAGVLWLLVSLGGQRYFLHAVVASLVLLVLFDPIRQRVREQLAQYVFRERFDLEKHLAELRRSLAHVVEPELLGPELMRGLESSQRVTHASLYWAGDGRRQFVLESYVGASPPERLEAASLSPVFDRLARDGYVSVEGVERELAEARRRGASREAETKYDIEQALEAMNASLLVPIATSQSEVLGLLAVRDDRVRDAFSPEETLLLIALAAQVAIAFENSLAYQRMKERDRLAALGEMAAGLAHEIRNPLGAIKASAQLLVDEPHGSAAEFLGIIVEETDRLGRVVGSFLDFARPSKAAPELTEVNLVVQRTLQVLAIAFAEQNVLVETQLTEEPTSVRIDAEQLRQVLLNLLQNAMQALRGDRRIHVSTALTLTSGSRGAWVEIRVVDSGIGIPEEIRPRLFVPFVTSKERGTGLGLAISQRIVTSAGGRISAHSRASGGTTFLIRLPARLPVSERASAETSAS